MIGLDSNILVRYLAADDPAQSPKAADIVERRLTEDDPGFVSIVAMVETVGFSTAPTTWRRMRLPPR